MHFISDKEIENQLDFDSLIPAIRSGFASPIQVPQRHHHAYTSGEVIPSTLLLMPAWEDGEFLGIKLVTVSPQNGKLKLPTIHGLYVLFDAKDGQPLLSMDARSLTAKRTAATSAVAALFLSREDSEILLMVGTGTLARQLIPAYASIRPIKKVLIWGRSLERAELLRREFKDHPFSIDICSDLALGVETADIISCATVSPSPLIMGAWLCPGHHLDLVGSYRNDMRESDDEAIEKSSVFVDSKHTAPFESGDLSIPIKTGKLKLQDIQADLFDLCKNLHPGRNSKKEITLFKSVGHALEDLVAAKMIYQYYKEHR